MPRIMCKDCDGTGFALPLMEQDCGECCGSGQVNVVYEAMQPALPDGDDGELVTALCDIEDLTDWEANFADSLYKRMEGGRELTDKQASTARDIVAKNQ